MKIFEKHLVTFISAGVNPVLKPLYDFWSFQVIPPMGQVLANDWDSYQYFVESIRNMFYLMWPKSGRFRIKTGENLKKAISPTKRICNDDRGRRVRNGQPSRLYSRHLFTSWWLQIIIQRQYNDIFYPWWLSLHSRNWFLNGCTVETGY